MDFAKNVLISTTCSKHKAVFRFAFSRSDLSCHHVPINLSNQSVGQRPAVSDYVGLKLT
jgi:hypothetical protein